MTITTILIILIILLLVGPNLGMVNGSGASFNPISLLSLVLVIVLILKLTGHVHF